MTDASDLYDEWTSGESSGVRPRRVQRLRNELRDVTGLEPPRQRVEIEEWVDRYKSEITKKLAEAAEIEESEGDESEDAESEDDE